MGSGKEARELESAWAGLHVTAVLLQLGFASFNKHRTVYTRLAFVFFLVCSVPLLFFVGVPSDTVSRPRRGRVPSLDESCGVPWGVMSKAPREIMNTESCSTLHDGPENAPRHFQQRAIRAFTARAEILFIRDGMLFILL